VPAWSRRLPFVLVVLLSLWMLFSPASSVPAGPPYSDKVVHALLFAALAATGLRAGLRPVLLVVGLATYAGISEVLQSLLPIHRYGDVADAAVDLAGVAVGTLAARRPARRPAARLR
jgi:VanZ family protein